MNLTPEQIQENWDKLIQIIKDTFEEGSERRENLLRMYHHFEERAMFAPASGVVYYHNAWPGGYVDHILNITKCAKKIYKMWKKMGAHTEEYTLESVIFCALHHDLGKLGDLTENYYVPNESEWHRINQGKMYNYNDKLHFMTVTDRAVYLLNHFSIDMTQIEYLALRLTDGMYEDANKGYLMGFGEGKNLKTNLPLILHQADMMATRLEKERYMFSKDSDINYSEILNPKLKEEREEQEKESVNNIKEAVLKKETPDILSDKSKDLFNELFGDK